MRVILTYFKDNGTYYTSGEYISEKKHVYEIIGEVRDMKNHGILPGGSSFIIHIEIPDHPHSFPALIL